MLPADAARLSDRAPAAPLVPVAEVLARLCAAAHPVSATGVAIAEAAGCVLAEAILATGPLPPHAVALRPGYAVNAAATAGAGPYSPTVLSLTPAWVGGGAALPPGCDAVLPAEALQVEAGSVEVVDAVPPGHWTRRVGEDLARDATLRGAGEVVRPLDVAVALAAGVDRVSVRRPRVVIVAGSGAAAAGASACLATLSIGCGAIVAPAHEAPRADVVLMLGPSAVDGRAGFEASIAAGIALRPGEETRVAVGPGTARVTLPERLDAALAVGLVIVGPYLRHLTEAATRSPSRLMTLSRKIVSTIGLTEVALLREHDGGLEPIATGDLSLSAMAAATHWLALPPDSEGLGQGAEVAAEPLWT